MHAHDHSRAHDRRLLAVALGLIVALMAGEVVAGLLAGSLALLADAGHMLTDAAALAGALVASRLATRPARGPWTFGLGRAEILAAQANGITFLLVATDLAAFAGTAVAGALVLATGWDRFDPIAGLLVAALMIRSSWTLLRESGRIFLEASPAGIDPAAVAQALAE